MKTILLSLAVCAAAFSASPVGDWTGTLKTPAPELRLAVHVQQTEAGKLTATMDSIDQGANGIPVSGVSFEGDRLQLDIQAVKGRFDGRLSDDGKTLSGVWSQGGRTLPLTFTRDGNAKADAVPDNSISAAPLVGVWEGALDIEGKKLNLRFTLQPSGSGQIEGKFDSLDQGAKGLPMSAISLTGSRFHFDLRGVGGAFDGTWKAEASSIPGTWKQGGAELPLQWKKVAR